MRIKKNVGGLDRGIRFAVGLSGLAIALFGRVGVYGRVKGFILGVAGLYTAATEYCPASQYLGVNTREVEKSRRLESVEEQRTEASAAVTPVI